MDFSEPTLKLILELTLFSGNKIKNSSDLSILIEASFLARNDRLLNDLSFTAKYLNGLGKILRDNTISKSVQGVAGNKTLDDSSVNKVRNEFKEHIHKFTFQVATLIKDIDEADRNFIEKKYLDMTRSSMMNLTSMIYDLTWLKKFLNAKEKK
jgi:hypothetical protein